MLVDPDFADAASCALTSVTFKLANFDLFVLLLTLPCPGLVLVNVQLSVIPHNILNTEINKNNL